MNRCQMICGLLSGTTVAERFVHLRCDLDLGLLANSLAGVCRSHTDKSGDAVQKEMMQEVTLASRHDNTQDRHQHHAGPSQRSVNVNFNFGAALMCSCFRTALLGQPERGEQIAAKPRT
eukprot:3964087-Amphidinium_carterae.1